jgi:hypothetical protein
MRNEHFVCSEINEQGRLSLLGFAVGEMYGFPQGILVQTKCPNYIEVIHFDHLNS